MVLPEEDEAQILDDLKELEALLATLGVEVVGRIVQKRKKIHAGSFFGVGKIDEIKSLLHSYGADR